MDCIKKNDDLYSIEFSNDCATITVESRSNYFQCYKENEENLSHMVGVIANNRGIYGTDIVDFECIFEHCTNHRFSVCANKKLGEIDSLTVDPNAKAVILLIIGCDDMGLCDVENILNALKKAYPLETEILFTAENTKKIEKGYYSLCILE